jgi:hypothetical protein
LMSMRMRMRQRCALLAMSCWCCCCCCRCCCCAAFAADLECAVCRNAGQPLCCFGGPFAGGCSHWKAPGRRPSRMVCPWTPACKCLWVVCSRLLERVNLSLGVLQSSWRLAIWLLICHQISISLKRHPKCYATKCSKWVIHPTFWKKQCVVAGKPQLKQ